MSGHWAEGIRRRLVYGVLANFFGKAVVAISQLVGVPIFLHFWGVKLYGEWMLLNAIPAYLALSDMGFGSAAANEMTILEARGERERVVEIFQSIWVLLTAISIAVGLLTLVVVPIIPLARWLHFSEISPSQTTWVVLLVTTLVVLGLQEQLFQCAFRCVGKYAYGVSMKAAIQLFGFAGMALAVVLHANVVQATIVNTAIMSLGTVVLWILLRREVPWIRLGWRHAHFSVIRSLSSAAFSFLGMPVSTAITLQGVLFVVNAYLGAAAVVLYTVTRTASRLALQILLTINNAVWPELSSAFGAGDIAMARRLHRRAFQAAAILSWLTVCVMFAFGPWIIRLWTHKDVTPSRLLLLFMLIAVVVQSLWSTSATLLYATNRLQRLSLLYLGGTLASLLLSVYLTRAAGVNGAALAMILGELVVAAYAFPATLAMVDDTAWEFIRSLFQPIHGFGLSQVAKTLTRGSIRES